MPHEMISKTKVEEQLKSLPDEFSVEDLIEKLYSTEKVDLDAHQIEMIKMSEQNIKDGDLLSQEEMRKLDSKWLG
ncbi:hypothetical protein [Salibacter sp.]|jgi:methionine-rich copper-binding protein CopC|uniref:hypothetical protein n=1 Tax=Salibacter sp. TaxID=2010995 RepID=UPI00287022A1|nr:hypothetical protein [Salibacter sp.]MDR9487315.1 hypothetical protein [Salibacter sp.]